MKGTKSNQKITLSALVHNYLFLTATFSNDYYFILIFMLLLLMTRKDVSIIFLIPMTLVLSIQYFKQKLTEWGARRQTGGNCINFCCNSSVWWALQSHEMLSRQNVIYAGMNKGLYCKLQNFRTMSCKVISPVLQP